MPSIRNWVAKLLLNNNNKQISWVRAIPGTYSGIANPRQAVSFTNIQNRINTMRTLATDSQIATALSYFATDATLTNTAGQIIWATSKEGETTEAADVVNALFTRWRINDYARDHILELATYGNLYLPTTHVYYSESGDIVRHGVALDNNFIPDQDYDVIPSTKIPPETVLHLYYHGEPKGFIIDPSDDTSMSVDTTALFPESSVIHFALGGMLGDYKYSATDEDGNPIDYDIKFATPLMEDAVQPTQTLNLLEDAVILSSLNRTIKFINVECGTDETEIRNALQQVKDAIEQQLSLNTLTGDTQSFVNPQSPNNLIYLPRVNGNDAISVTDLNMAQATEADDKLLDYYQNKKLSVLGVPKEAMNYSSNEGLGGAGSVLSQRSALYANSLQRLETAYMGGWRDAINKYFTQRGMSGFVDKYQLHMQPIITIQSTVQFDKRDSALNQATTLADLFNQLGVDDRDSIRAGLAEILSEVFPQIGASVPNWDINTNNENEGGGGMY
jgi:hypothetical protein